MDESMSDQRLTDAQREQLLMGAQKLAELEKKLIEAQRELTEAARCFQYADVREDSTPEPKGKKIPPDAVCVVRDSCGAIVATTLAGESIYKSGAETYAGPFTVWVLDGNEIIKKQHFDVDGTWWLS